MSAARRRWATVLFFAALVIATRYPLAPHQLFTFDDVNLAYSIGHFDIRISQPQPPGYPLFVMEMRALSWLRFRRAENILLALSLAGSIAALLLLAFAGNRLMGGQAGFFGAALLVLNPVFWHAGVTSALRIQLAIASLAVAASCWRAWQGDRFWVPRSAIVLGLAAGIRPEIGPLLFPLWAVSARRARVKWEDVRFALGAMAVAVLAWLAPTMWASGGPAGYVRACLSYLNDQAGVTSGLFGSDRGMTTFWRLVVWTLALTPACVLPGVLAWRRGEGWAMGRGRLVFLALWFLPAFVFACFVHLEDPGQALGMTVVVALAGGYLVNRAVDEAAVRISRWNALWFAAAALAVMWMTDRDEAASVAWAPVLALTLGLLLRTAQTKTQGNPPRAALAMLILGPAVAMNLTMFEHRGWYYRGPGAMGAMLEGLNSGLALTSLEHIRNTLDTDDHAIRAVRELSQGRQALVIWEQGLATWRKVTYYLPSIPVAVLERRHLRADSAPVVALWRGTRRAADADGGHPRIEAPAGGRIVWLINPRTEFYRDVQAAFAPQAHGSALFTDLPAEHGSRMLGAYELAW